MEVEQPKQQRREEWSQLFPSSPGETFDGLPVPASTAATVLVCASFPILTNLPLVYKSGMARDWQSLTAKWRRCKSTLKFCGCGLPPCCHSRSTAEEVAVWLAGEWSTQHGNSGPGKISILGGHKETASDFFLLFKTLCNLKQWLLI